MTEVVLDDRLLVAILGAIATLGLAVGANRRHVARLEDRLWGPERGTDGGVEETVASLAAEHRRIDSEVDRLRRRLQRLEDEDSAAGPAGGPGATRNAESPVGNSRPVRFRPGDVD